MNPQFIEVEKNRRLVVLTEEEYDKLLDVIDNIVAQRIEADESDPVLSWEEFSRKIVKNRIAEARKARGISQEELAKKLRINLQELKTLEKKDNRPELQTIKKVAKALNCQVENLI